MMANQQSFFVEDERKFEKHTLGNGLQCVFIQDPAQEDIAMRLSVPGGLASDPPDLRGLSYIAMETMFRGSLSYPGPHTFKNFLLDSEATIEIESFDYSTSASFSVPEFVFDEFLTRLMNAIHAPTFTFEGINATFERRKMSFYDHMQDDLTRFIQIIIIALTGRDDYGCAQQNIFKRKDLVSLLRVCHSKNIRPTGMRLYLCSGLQVSKMKDYVVRTFGQLRDSTPGAPLSKLTSSTLRNSSNNEETIKLVESFTKNDEKTLYFTFVLPKGCSTSSALYVGYLLSMSQPGSLQYFWKTEGFIEWVRCDYRYFNREIQTICTEVRLTSKGSNHTNLLVNSFMGFVEIIKASPPNVMIFNQARDYYSILRKRDKTIRKPNKIFVELELDNNFSEILCAEIPHKYLPEEIALVAKNMSAKNLIVVSLSNEHKDAQLYPHTDFYLQYSIKSLHFSPFYQNMCFPAHNPLLVGSRQYQINTRDLVCVSQDPTMYLKTMASQANCVVKLRIDAPEFMRYSHEALKIYAAWLQYKIWLLQVEPVFEVDIKAQAHSLCITIKSVPESTSRVFEFVVWNLLSGYDHNLPDKLDELKQKVLEQLDTGASESIQSLLSIDLEAVQNSYDVQAQKQRIREVSGVKDLPSFSRGKVSILLGGNFDRNTFQSCYRLACMLQNGHPHLHQQQSVLLPEMQSNADNAISSNATYRPTQVCGSHVTPILKAKTTQNKDSACVKMIRIGVFTYRRWAAALAISRIMNTFCQASWTCSESISQFCARAFYNAEGIWLLLSVSGSNSGHALNKLLDKNIAEARLYLNDTSLNSIDYVRAKISSDVLNIKEELDEEISRLWTPIWANCADSCYFEQMQAALRDLDPRVVQLLYESTVSGCEGKTQTIIFFGKEESELAWLNLTHMELSLYGLYQPIEDMEEIPLSSVPVHQTKYADDTNSSLDDAIMTERLITGILSEFQ